MAGEKERARTHTGDVACDSLKTKLLTSGFRSTNGLLDGLLQVLILAGSGKLFPLVI